MKAVTYALLVANLFLFGWLYTHPQVQRPNEVTHTPGFPAAVEPLVLLRERTKATAPASAEEPRSAEQEQTAENAVPVNAAAEPAREEASVPMVAVDASLPAQAPDSAGSAVAPNTTATEAEPAPAPADLAAVATPERICQTIGPFPRRPQVNAFVAELAKLGHQPSIRTAQIEQPSGYWVYLPAMPRSEAVRIVDDLSAKGVKDYFLGRQNFISLGVFSDKRSAETRVREISAIGYAPRLEPRFLTREVLWVDLEESSAQRIEDAQWAALLKELVDIRRQSVACE